MSDSTSKTREYAFPTSFLYSSGHVWVLIDDLVATIGLTEFVFDLVHRQYFYIQLPEVGETIKIGEMLAAVDALKVAMPVITPLSGTVAEVNQDLTLEPGIPLESPYSRGWLVKLELSNPIELRQLMRIDTYKEFITSRETLDFLKSF